MKKALEILKDRPRVSVTLTRDSVCAGDDCDAPHEKGIKLTSFVDPEALAREASSGYLPTVAGIGHSWTCTLNERKIATVKTDGIIRLVEETIWKDENRIHFTYHSANY